MKTLRVLVLGNVTVDHVLSTHGLPEADTKINATGYEVYAGGQAANVAATLALLGFDVRFAGRFGDDPGGVLNRQAFAKLGVDLGLSQTVENCRHHFACILVSGRQRTITMYRDPRLGLDSLEIPQDQVSQCAAIYTDGHEGPASLRLAAQARRAGVPVIADMEAIGADSAALVALTDHLIAPLQIVQQLGGHDDIVEALRAVRALGPSNVVATMGVKGAAGLAEGADRPEFVAAVACDVIDTTGAGDAFHAGYLASLLRGQTLRERLEFAAAIASKKCETAGPRLTALDTPAPKRL